MAMFINTGFEYNGIRSELMNIIIISDPQTSGMADIPFGVSQTEKGEQVRSEYYHYRSDLGRMKFTVYFTLNDMNLLFDKDTRVKLSNWLITDDFKPFRSDDLPNVVYYCKADGDLHFYNSSMFQGYFSISFICNTYSGYSELQTQREYFSINDKTNGKVIIINNLSNVAINKYFYPLLQISLGSSDTGITINNVTDGNRKFEFTGLQNSEIIDIDNKKQRITSSVGDSTYRLSNLTNKQFLRLVQGENRLLIKNFSGTLFFKNQFQIAL